MESLLWYVINNKKKKKKKNDDDYYDNNDNKKNNNITRASEMICFSYKLVDWTEEPMHLMLGSHSIFLCHYINQLFLQIFRPLELKNIYKNLGGLEMKILRSWRVRIISQSVLLLTIEFTPIKLSIICNVKI